MGANAAYLVTGATGYIGSMLVEQLLQQGHPVTVLVRNPGKLPAAWREQLTVIQADLTTPVEQWALPQQWEHLHIFHCAASTQSAEMVRHPVAVADSIVLGTRHILELARRFGAESMVYLSSMEVYGQVYCEEGQRIGEDTLGQVDLTKARSCYPMAKRMAETYCCLYAEQYGLPVKIARLAQTFGRGVPATDNRVFAQFARAVRTGTDIVLHTPGTSMGNYCDLDDALQALCFLDKHGQSGQAYNVVNEENTMMIRQMAQLVADELAAGKIRVVFDIPADDRYGYAAPTGLRLSGQKLRDLGWQATTPLVEMYRKLLDGGSSI